MHPQNSAHVPGSHGCPRPILVGPIGVRVSGRAPTAEAAQCDDVQRFTVGRLDSLPTSQSLYFLTPPLGFALGVL